MERTTNPDRAKVAERVQGTVQYLPGLGEMEWIRRPLTCDDVVVAESLDPDRVSDAELKSISLRMHAIFHTIEMPRAEERWMPVELFEKIDTLECLILRIDPQSLSQFKPPRLADWKSVITEFGVHYNLKGFGPIRVDPKIFRETTARYGI